MMEIATGGYCLGSWRHFWKQDPCVTVQGPHPAFLVSPELEAGPKIREAVCY